MPLANTNAVVIPTSMASIDATEDLVALCKATADSLRLQILRVLHTESFGVLEICRIFAIRQPALSHHLKVLASAGLVSTRKEGNSIFYRRALISASEPLREMKSCLFQAIDNLPLDGCFDQQIAAIQKERSLLSVKFFNKNAQKFREKQGLVTEYSQYALSLQDLIKGANLPSSTVAMEVGPGEGELLLSLAQTYNKVFALDNSREMLDKAKATIAQHPCQNVSFIHGETALAVEQKRKVGLLVFNMVLHHISSPAEVFQHAANLLEADGVLLIVDLCRHNQDWVRESCGDLWLGFDSEDLNQWAQRAELSPGQSLYLGLRNGFQIQMRIFINQVAVIN